MNRTKPRVGWARAHANIALAKYWGKLDSRLNLPAVPSISLTLDALHTTTVVEFLPGLRADELAIEGTQPCASDVARATELLERIRRLAGTRTRARVRSASSFPTASGLASSASGFAALAAAACAAAGITASPEDLSRIARRSSASAARSVFGGFVELPAGTAGDDSLRARRLAQSRPWSVALVVAIVDGGRKTLGSTEGMERTRRTSPYYAAWLETAPRLAREIRAGIRARNLDRVGRAMEASTLAFHASALAAEPAVLYWRPTTLAALLAVERLRSSGAVQAYATMDAGPHVKVLCSVRHAACVERSLRRVRGVIDVIVCRPGPDVCFGNGPLPGRFGAKR